VVYIEVDVIEINHEYHGIEVTRFNQKLIDHLKNKYGPPGDRWFYRTSVWTTTVYFKDPKDHLMTLLELT
jgi:hypothetical protein